MCRTPHIPHLRELQEAIQTETLSQLAQRVRLRYNHRNSKGYRNKGEVTGSAEFKKTEKDPYLKYIDGSYDVYIKKPDGWGDKINC